MISYTQLVDSEQDAQVFQEAEAKALAKELTEVLYPTRYDVTARHDGELVIMAMVPKEAQYWYVEAVVREEEV